MVARESLLHSEKNKSSTKAEMLFRKLASMV